MMTSLRSEIERLYRENGYATNAPRTIVYWDEGSDKPKLAFLDLSSITEEKYPDGEYRIFNFVIPIPDGWDYLEDNILGFHSYRPAEEVHEILHEVARELLTFKERDDVPEI